MTKILQSRERVVDFKSINKIFSGISPESEKKLKKLNIRTRTFDSNQLIYEKGAEITDILFITKGTLKVSEILSDGKEIVSWYYYAQDALPFYLYYAYIYEYPHQVCSFRKSEVVFVPLDGLVEIVGNDIRFMENVLRFVAEDNFYNKYIMRCNEYNRIAQRLAYYLLECEQIDKLKMAPTQEALADILRVNRSSLNQELKKLKDQGVIATTGMKFKILDREYLETLIDEN